MRKIRQLRQKDLKFGLGALVAVQWVDAMGCAMGWVLCDDAKPRLAVIQSVGWVLDETDEYLCLAPTISSGSKNRTPGVMGMITIPKSCIRKRCCLSAALDF